MNLIFKRSVKVSTGPPGGANTTKAYSHILRYLDIPEPLFFAIIATACLLVLLTCCLITFRILCKGCFGSGKKKLDKKKHIKQQEINAIIQQELDFVRGYGKIEFVLNYSSSSEMIRVKVMQVSDLPVAPDGSLDPYVIVTSISKSNNEEKRTKTKIKNECPTFNQIFKFKILKDEFQDAAIAFKVLDFDRFGADALLGQLTVHLKDIDRGTIWNQDSSFTKNLEEGEDICQGMGQVCVILNHTKTGLIITILEAKNLRIKEHTSFKFVFITIKYQTPKLSSKYKTKIVRESSRCPISQCPYFNETFSFPNSEVPLGQCRVKLKVCMGAKMKAPRYIGYIILGSKSSSQSGKIHWENMLDNPRHPVAKWHVLVNPGVKD